MNSTVYQYSDIEDYYKKQNGEIQNIINKIREHETLKSKAITRKKNNLILFTTEPDNDLTVLSESLQIKDAHKSTNDKNKLLIPIKSNNKNN